MEQKNNDISCEHVVTHKTFKFHVSKVRPFFGELDDAIEVAKRDDDQWTVIEVKGFIGNVHQRESLGFLLDFEMGFSEMVNYNLDTKNNFMIKNYILNRPWMRALTFETNEKAK